jgi:hypothetical protein
LVVSQNGIFKKVDRKKNLDPRRNSSMPSAPDDVLSLLKKLPRKVKLFWNPSLLLQHVLPSTIQSTTRQ